MHALIISTDGVDYVHVGNLDKVEKKAIDFIKNELDVNKTTAAWSSFGQLEIEQCLMESLQISDVNTAMELFTEVSDARDEMVFMRIVPAELELDS